VVPIVPFGLGEKIREVCARVSISQRNLHFHIT